MHYQLFGSVAVTEEWAGNSKGIVQPFIKGLVTKAQASQFWVMLPSYLHAAGIKVDLPANHNLDSAMTAARVLSVSTAQAAMKSVMAKLAEAKVKAAAKRPAELKTRQAEYNKRAYLARKAKALAAQPQGQPAQSEVQPAPSPIARWTTIRSPRVENPGVRGA